MRRFKTQLNLVRAALTLLVMMTCATAWAETQIVTYIDENGTERNKQLKPHYSLMVAGRIRAGMS